MSTETPHLEGPVQHPTCRVSPGLGPAQAACWRAVRLFGPSAVVLACAVVGIGCVKSRTTELTPAALTAAAYSGRATPGGVLVDDRAVATALSRAVSRAVAGGARPIEDGRLARLAGAIGGHLGPTGLLPASSTIEALARQLGLVDPAFQAFVLPQGAVSEVSDALTRAVAERSDPMHGGRSFTHFGMAPRRAYGGSYWIVVLTERHLVVDPVAREARLGAALRLAADAPFGYGPLTITIERSGDKISHQVPADSPLALDLPTDRAGKMRVEVAAKRGASSRLLAVMPVFVGVQAPTVDRPDSTPPGVTVGDLEQALAAAVARGRAQASVPPLALEPALTAAARQHCQAMAAVGRVGHRGADGSTPADRLARAGYLASTVLQNVGKTRDPIELHQEFMEKPAQRATVVSDRVTHFGIAVCAAGADYFVSELFANQLPPLDSNAAPAQILKALNRVRTERGLPVVKLDDALSEVAADAVHGYFIEPFPGLQQVVDSANLELRDFIGMFSKTAAVMSPLATVAEAVDLPNVLDGGATHIGIAVARGARPQAESGRSVVLVTIGWAR